MTAIYQSPFLLALGWTIASSLWQTALLWMVYQVLTNTSNRLSPAAKHNLAFTSILFAFGWFGITLSAKYNELLQALPVTDTLNVAGTAIDTTGADGFVLTTFLNQYLPYISASYLLVLALLAVRLMKAYLYAQRVKTKGLLEIDEYWTNKVDRYTGYLRIDKKVRIYLSSYIDVPATLNFFKPVILLPVAAFTQLTPHQVESIILHELAHIKRNDYIINIIVSVIETILFFNPFVYLLVKSLKKEREHCCDDFVLHFRFDPHSYASALLSLEKLRMHTTPVGAIAATGNSGQLLGRVKRIMNVKSAGFNYGQKLLVLLITACILISVAWLSPNAVQKKANEEKLAEKTIEEEVCEEPEAMPLAAQTEKRMEIRSFNRKPVTLKEKPITPLTPRTTLSATTITSTPAVPASPLPVPQTEFYPVPSSPAIVTDNIILPDAFYWNEDVLNIRKSPELKKISDDAAKAREGKSLSRKNADKDRMLIAFADLFKEKGIDLKNHELKLHQLEQLLNANFFETVDIDFDANEFKVDVNVKKTTHQREERAQEESIKRRKSVQHFEWNEERKLQQEFRTNKVQLDSLRERSFKMAERQKQLWVKKAEAARNAQHAIQQVYAKLIAEHDRNEKSTNIRGRKNEKTRVTSATTGTISFQAEPRNVAAAGYVRQGNRQSSSDEAVSSVQQQISRVLIDTGKGNKMVVISIE
ncbi:MAG: M56 family metallopeptidase [Agriterribacter sp.]